MAVDADFGMSLDRRHSRRWAWRVRSGLLSSALILLCLPVFAAEKAPQNWPAFRGRNASGDGGNVDLPLTWDIDSGHNIRWKTPIPGLGHSSPIVWDRRVFLTTAISSNPQSVYALETSGKIDRRTDRAAHQWKLMALDRVTGKVIWDRLLIERAPRVPRHPKNSYASATPATDGRYLVAWLGGEGLYCYSLDGRRLWHRDLGAIVAGASYDDTYVWGPASSPIIHGDTVIVQADAQRDSFIAGFDLASGKPLWRTPRNVISSFSTPTLCEHGGQTALITNGAGTFFAYDPASGRELWRMSGSSLNTTPTPVVGGGLIYVASGYKNVQSIFAIRPGGRGDITPADKAASDGQLAWSVSKGGPYMTTPLYHDGHLYVNRRGILSCYAADSGTVVYRKRISGGPFYASPVIARGRIYLLDQSGHVSIVSAGKECRRLAENEMQTPCMATPAVTTDGMLIRTLHELVAIGRTTGTKPHPRPKTTSRGTRRFDLAQTLGDRSLRSAAVHLGDIDGDRDWDVAVAVGRHGPAQNSVFINDGHGRFVEARPFGSGADRTYATPLADLDGDGDLDLAVGNDADPNQIYLNDGQGRFQPGTRFGPPSQNTRNVTLADLDSDRDIDILVANRRAANFIYLNDGSGTFSNGIPFGSGADSTISVAVGDLDADGDLDLVLGNRDGLPNVVLINRGRLRFAAAVPVGDGKAATRSITVADFNGDQRLDILAGNIRSPNHVLLNDGQGRFPKTMDIGRQDGATYSVAAADMDRDGDMDLIVGNNGQANVVYFNDGAARFTTTATFGDPRGRTYAVAVGDLNGDGFADIAVANSGEPDRIFFNVPVHQTSGDRRGTPRD